jgi:Winged helix-turn helix
MSSFQQNIIKHKVGLLNLAVELGNVSKACQMMGMSRDTFYRYRNAHEAGGVQALLDANKRKPIMKNRVDPLIEEAVIRFATEQPAFGQARTSNELRKNGMIVSSGGVRSIWLRNSLETFAKRLKALEVIVAATGQVLTEAQVRALETKAQDDLAHGEIETAHPGYLGSQDTFYVGTLKCHFSPQSGQSVFAVIRPQMLSESKYLGC